MAFFQIVMNQKEKTSIHWLNKHIWKIPFFCWIEDIPEKKFTAFSVNISWNMWFEWELEIVIRDISENLLTQNQISTDIKNPDITHRIIRFKLNDNSEELLITNIYDTQFTVEDFKTLYHFRWPIETKYDELKNKFQLEKFTGKTLNSVYQDFYNQMTNAKYYLLLTYRISSLEINFMLGT